MLKSLTGKEKQDWRKHLAKLAFAYNSTVNKSTGFSPFYLMFGRESKLPIDLVFQEVREMVEMNTQGTYEQFADEWKQSMMKAFDVARTNIGKSAQYNKKYFDKKANAVEIDIGDAVLVKNDREKGGTGKLKSWWVEAIFKVVEKMEGLPVYKVKNIRKSRDIRVLHRNKLMKYNDLPLDVFEEIAENEEIQPRKAKSVKKKRTVRSKSSSESDQEDDGTIAVFIDRDELVVSETHSMSAEDDVPEEIQTNESLHNENATPVDELPVEEEVPVEEETPVEEEDVDSSGDVEEESLESSGREDIDQDTDTNDDSDDRTTRPVSSRTRVPKKIFDMPTLGGNPTWKVPNSSGR